MSNRKFSQAEWNKRHISQVESYAAQIEATYQTALKEAARLAVTLNISPDKPFSFDRYPSAKARINAIMTRLIRSVNVTIQSGIQAEWSLSNQKNDALVSSILPTTKLPKAALEQYMNRNLKALAAFQNRKVGGLGLSDRVFQYAGQFRKEIEMGLDVGLGEGRSAARISQDLRSYLNNPDLLFRRVRDKRGQLVLSKNAAALHPGQGVYRSSYKNVVRMTRTEVNQSYHSADMARYQQLSFIVGYEVRRSNNLTTCDVCESLKGKYPKTFVFRSWHPQCRCHSVPILATEEELRELNRMILRGEDTTGFRSQNEVVVPHEGFTRWVTDNQDRLARAKSQPWFMSDNGLGSGNLPPQLPKPPKPLPYPTGGPLIDLKQLIAGNVPTNAEMKAVIKQIATVRPDLFSRGFEGTSILKSKSYLMQVSTLYNPKTKQWSSQTALSISTHDFSLSGTVYNPVEQLRGALSSLRSGTALTFDQEYAIEALWHEILHARSATPPRKLKDYQVREMETLNQFVARHTYSELLGLFGVSPVHVEAILEKGYGYKEWVANFRAKLKSLGIAEEQAVADLTPALMDDYEEIYGKVNAYLKR